MHAAYARALRGRGYTPRSAVNESRQVARLSRWLDGCGLTVSSLTRMRVEEFLAYQRSIGRFRSNWSRPGLLCLLEMLADLGIVDAVEQSPAASPREVLLDRFGQHLSAERGLAAGTVRGYVAHAERFLEGLASVGLADVTAADVTAAVLRESSAVSVSATQNFVAGLRAFLRFCFVEGLVRADLSAGGAAGDRPTPLVPAAGDQPAPTPGRCWPAVTGARRSGGATTRCWSCCCGWDCGAVRWPRLRLDDIDWRAGELVVRGKGAREDRLPLPAEVGEAIAAYLRRGRPETNRREVFLRARAPIGSDRRGHGLLHGAAGVPRAGIAEIGAHRLRHTVACEMVAAGVPLTQIGQVLRHHSLQSTAIYARVDVDAAAVLAAPWPTGARP